MGRQKQESARQSGETMSLFTEAMDLRPRMIAPPVVGVRAGTFVLVSVFIAAWLISLSRSLFDPIGFDQALYQYITERVMLGQRLYTDVWDQNAPGIIGIHWLSTLLIGREPIALRLFDAVWQCATLAALIALPVRDGRRWQVGWLAGILYLFAYYGLGYVHTAQREGFAVLPLLLAVHALASPGQTAPRTRTVAPRHMLAGVLFFIVFAIKPPLGLCFGTVWLLGVGTRVGAVCLGLSRAKDSHDPSGRDRSESVGPSLQRWRCGLSALNPQCRSARTAIVPLTLGFVLSAAIATLILMTLGWWDGFWRVLLRKDVAGYIRGPQLIRELMPLLVAGTLAAAVIVLAAYPGLRRRTVGITRTLREMTLMSIVGIAAFATLLTLQRWPEWQQAFFKLGGLLFPAVGAVVLAHWRQHSQIWRLSVLMATASLAAIFWQGHFALYQFPPLLAFAAYLAAMEILARFSELTGSGMTNRIWTAICIGGVVHLAAGTWGWTMTYYGTSPYVLSDTTLARHYTKVTNNKSSFPNFATTAMAAARVRELTTHNDPIICLVDEPRLYYLAQRPPAYPLLRTQACYSSLFPGLFETIRDGQPKIILARLPASLRGTHEPSTAEPAVMAELEAFFGPLAGVLRDRYRVAEIINGDVCILRPRNTS